MRDDQEREILEILQSKKKASTEELAEKLYVSPSTVRRKLNALQKKGLAVRIHGGAQIGDGSEFLPSFATRSHQNAPEKKRIALTAARLIRNGDLIFLDGSSSAFFIAGQLSGFKNVKVVTNGIDTLSLLSRAGVEAYSTGGRISPANRSVLVGHYAEEMISSLHADIAFFSAQSVTADGEVYDCFEEENVLRRKMLQGASRSVLLCDSTKFRKTSPFRLCALSDVDCLVSDRDVRPLLDADDLPELLFP